MHKRCLFLLLCAFLLAACQTQPPASIPQTGVTEPAPAQLAPTEPAATPTLALTATEPPAPTEPIAADSGYGDPPEEGGAVPASGGAADEIFAAMTALNAVDSFRVDQTIDSPDIDMLQQIEIVMPDRFRLVNPDMEMIITEGQAYIIVDGQSMAVPGADDTVVDMVLMPGSDLTPEAFRAALRDPQALGEEDLNGERVKVYQFTMPGEDGTTSLVKLWAGAADGLPRRLTLTISGGESDGTVIDNLYKDFNAPITIEPPG